MIGLLLSVALVAPTELEIATCTGVSNAIQDTGVATAATEPVLAFYSDRFSAVLHKHKKLPASVLDAYTKGYSVGVTYTDGKLGDMYWECVSLASTQTE